MSAPLSVAPPSVVSRRPRARWAATGALAGLLVALLGGGWLLWDNRRLDITGYDVPIDQLPPEAEGLSIAQVSDLHAASFGTFPQRIVAAVDSARPDLIAITGDLIDVRTVATEQTLEVVSQLQQIAPCYLVLGNHEADSDLRPDLLRELEALGVVILRDEAVTVEVAGTPLTLVGLDDPRVAASTDRKASSPRDLLRAMELPEAATTVLLAHRPELLGDYTGVGVDLVLSGHAHGGQVRVPGIGGVYAPHQGLLPELTEGVHLRDGTTMVISRGLGNSIAGVRVNNPRELVLVELTAR
ncbi:metallophosphoesterase [Brachybacterium alimentarium]|uniref:metallophosphoesterase n=1 Tax=Brachybacterium alimentarium TaxID=47845 RepID=UPI003FB915F2